MADPNKKALFDELAEQLSEKTGSEFKVIREHYGHEVSGRKMVKYRIAVSRNSVCADINCREMHRFTFAFGCEKDSNRVSAVLAMLLDLINMGYVQLADVPSVWVNPPRNEPVSSLLQQACQAKGFIEAP